MGLSKTDVTFYEFYTTKQEPGTEKVNILSSGRCNVTFKIDFKEVIVIDNIKKSTTTYFITDINQDETTYNCNAQDKYGNKYILLIENRKIGILDLAVDNMLLYH